MCGQTLLFIVIANCAIVQIHITLLLYIAVRYSEGRQCSGSHTQSVWNAESLPSSHRRLQLHGGYRYIRTLALLVYAVNSDIPVTRTHVDTRVSARLR